MFTKILCASLAVMIAIMCQMDYGDHCIVAVQKAKIRATRQEVFDTVSNLDGYRKWHPGLGRIHALDPKSQNHIGKEYVEVAQMPHGETHYSLVVSGYTPPMYFSFTIDSVLESLHEYTLEVTEPNITTVTLKVVSRRRSYFFHYLVAPPLKFLYSQQILQIMYNLKIQFH